MGGMRIMRVYHGWVMMVSAYHGGSDDCESLSWKG